MRNKYLRIVVFCLALMLVFFGIAWAESLTVTTYYPSPYGSYRELTAKKMKVGTSVSSTIDDNQLFVQGAVGIGSGVLDYLSFFQDFGVKLMVYGGGIYVANVTPAMNGITVASLGSNSVGFKTASTASDGWSADFDGRMKVGGSSYLATVSGAVGIGTTSPTTTQDSRDVKLEVSTNIIADDVYLQSPKSGSAGWVSTLISAVMTQLMQSVTDLTILINGKANTSHSHSVSCSCSASGGYYWSGYGGWAGCSSGQVADGVDVEGQTVAIRCRNLSCSCSVS